MDAKDRPQPATTGLVLTAAGSSSRMGGGKKEYRDLYGMPVLLHSLLTFFTLPSLTQTVITIPAGDKAYVERLLGMLPERFADRRSAVTLTSGGASRSDSVLRGLESFPEVPEHVLIHDGARPWISAELITRVLETTARYGACIPVVPATNAMKSIDEEGVIRAHLPRRSTVAAQTPQGFSYRSILAAHRRAAADDTTYIDDSEIYSRYVGEVHTVPGDPENIKITYARDLSASQTAPRSTAPETAIRHTASPAPGSSGPPAEEQQQ